MMPMEKAMTDLDKSPNEWEAREAAARRRTYWLFGGLAGAGFVVGLTTALVEPEDAGLMTGGTIPPALAILFAAITIVAIVLGSWRMWRHADELDRTQHLWANSVAVSVAMLSYMLWFLLWKGGLLPEPSAHPIFLATVIAGCATYIWKKVTA